MVSILRLTDKRSQEGQDRFFLWSMVILPILAQGAYIFDAFYFMMHHNPGNAYEGLVSTILIVFAYLRYCAPIESRVSLFIYYIFLCLLSIAGNIGYMVAFILRKESFFVVVYICWAVIEVLITVMLIYCRVICQYQINFVVENKHLFHFMSRLEIILAIFIPFFTSEKFVTVTRDSIAFFLLFDFFSESYSRFRGVWIKSALYLFVATVTVAVATEWLYFAKKLHFYEQISAVSELISACLCSLLIILQFFPYHFTPLNVTKIAREAFNFQQRLSMIQAAETATEQTVEQKPAVPIDSPC